MVTEVEQPVMRTAKLLGRIIDVWLAGKRRLWMEGGTYASKTWAAMQFLTLIGENYPDPLHITVISETMPHLKQGCILDFRSIMGDTFNEKFWNKTDYIYRWPSTGSWMQFLSADQPSKAAGPRRDILFVNEANHIARDTFRQADMRTHLFTIADWNPESEFWFHNEELTQAEIYEDRKLINTNDVFLRGLTYRDALDVMPPGKRKEIEDWEFKDPNWFNIYGLGLIGKVEGLVYPYFQQVEELPRGDVFYGLDFGFSNDPTVVVANVVVGDALYSRELIYETGLTNDMIARRMGDLGIKPNYDEIFADSAEPKSIEEIHAYGFNIKPAPKGPGSVEYGHQKVRQYKQFWTKDSTWCIKEQRNFRYIQDKDGKFTEKTTHKFSHGMDARRYGIMGLFEPQEAVEDIVVYDSMQLVGNIDIG